MIDAELNVAEAISQYRAAVTSCAIFSLTDWTRLEISGADRAQFLHNFCTNDIKKLAVDRGCQAFITTVQGKILGHFFVYATADRLKLLGAPGQGERVVKHLSRYHINEEIEIGDVTGQSSLQLVTGPNAGAILGKIGCDAGAMVDGERRLHVCENGTVEIVRNDFCRQVGYLIDGPMEPVNELMRQLQSQGAVVADLAVFESLRIAAGFPIWGRDLTDANLAQEASLTDRAISFTKGCYLGQEPIARIDALGHVNQELRLLRIENSQTPNPGTEVRSTDADAKSIGQISSAARDYASTGCVALAMLKRQYISKGTKVTVDIEGEQVAATVDWLT